MDWVTVSLASAACFAVVSVLDKVVLDRYVPNPATFNVVTGALQLPGALLILCLVPLESHPSGLMATAYASGFLWGISLVIMFYVLRQKEVSRVVAVYQTSPVFVAILAVMFLGEKLTTFHWIAILVTVVGAALIARHRTSQFDIWNMDFYFYLLLVASALAAGGQLLSKVALDEMSLWNMFVLRNVGLATAMVLIPFKPFVIGEIFHVMKSPRRAWLVILNEGIIAFGAVLLTLWAISLGPVSLVVTLASTRPLFVFGLSVFLSTNIWHVLDEPLDRATLTIKLVSSAMIVGGVAAISTL